MSDELEQTAQRIADRGREALTERMRPAFARAAAAHADVLALGDEQVEAMVQRAVERADGMQWRTALATVASEELGIEFGAALGHPAVQRAQVLAGAPSYEESLAGVAAASVESETPAEPDTSVEPDSPAEPESPGEPEAPAEPETPGPTARFTAIHLGGIPDLADDEDGVAVSLSDDGIDIVHATGEVVGRIAWEDVTDVVVEAPRGVRRRRRREAHVVIQASTGDASFQANDVVADELWAQLAPVLERRGGRR